MTNTELRNFLFPACAVRDGILYAITEIEHLMIKIDLSDGSVELMDYPKGYDPQNHMGTDRFILYKDKILAFEMRGNRILQYSISSNQCEYIAINCGKHSCYNFAGCYIYGQKMHIFPSYLNEVVTYDFDKQKLNSNSLCFSSYEFEKSGKPIPRRLFSCSCRVGNDVWVFTEEKQIALCYDLLSGNTTSYQIPEEIVGCIDVKYDQEGFYILDKKGNVFVWSIEKGIIQLYKGADSNLYMGKLVITKTDIWILPEYEEDIFLIEKKSGERRVYTTYPKDFYYCDENWSKYYCMYEENGFIYLGMHLSNYILQIDKESGIERWIQIKIPSIIDKIDFYQRNEVKFHLEKNCSLETYLQYLCNSTQNTLHDGGIGGNIFGYFINLERAEKNESM